MASIDPKRGTGFHHTDGIGIPQMISGKTKAVLKQISDVANSVQVFFGIKEWKPKNFYPLREKPKTLNNYLNNFNDSVKSLSLEAPKNVRKFMQGINLKVSIPFKDAIPKNQQQTGTSNETLKGATPRYQQQTDTLTESDKKILYITKEETEKN